MKQLFTYYDQNSIFRLKTIIDGNIKNGRMSAWKIHYSIIVFHSSVCENVVLSTKLPIVL